MTPRDSVTSGNPGALAPQRCGAATRSGGSCRAWAIEGGTRCRMHGGASPRAKAAAARRLAEARAAKALSDVEVREVADPIGEFQRLASEAVAVKDWMAGHVAALQGRLRYQGANGGEQLRAEVAVYERAMDRAGRFLEAWVKLGMEERLVRVQELQARRIADALDRALTAAGVPGEQRQAAVQHLAQELRS